MKERTEPASRSLVQYLAGAVFSGLLLCVAASGDQTRITSRADKSEKGEADAKGTTGPKADDGDRGERGRRGEGGREDRGGRRGRDRDGGGGKRPRRAYFSFPKENVGPEPALAKAFEPFKDKLRIGWDEDFLYIECDSMPDHRLMVGITAWNQQVPLPQPYTGSNAWRLPLKPRIAAKPVSASETLFRGSIAVAINGVPIFNPIKQDGRTDTNLAGELDEFGGHAGRADDYHYHIPPWHLTKVAGKGNPVAIALDGFPVYAAEEPDGKPVRKLDWLNGHQYPSGLIQGRIHLHEHGEYHYHGTKTYPYLNGGFKGEVELENGQVKVQPRAGPVRTYTRPLRGASITDFKSEGNEYSLNYRYQGKTHAINYTINKDGTYDFEFVNPDGRTKKETYRRRKTPDRGPPRP